MQVEHIRYIAMLPGRHIMSAAAFFLVTLERMMSFCRIPLLLLFIIPTAFALQECELNGEYVNPANGNMTAGKTGIMKCRDRDSGLLVREQELRAGNFIGLVRYYNRDGKPEREFRVNEKGNREGLAHEFFPDGRLAREANYRNGSVVGSSCSWHPNGSLKRASAFGEDGRETAFAEFNERGQLRELRCAERPVLGKEVDDATLCGHGARAPVVRDLFSDKGVPRGRVAYLAGKLSLSESLGDNGKVQEQSEFGKDTSVDRSFSPEGVKLRETRWIAVERGRTKELEQEFHASGSLTRERRWQEGELAGEKNWYLNGQLKSDYRYTRRDGRSVCDLTDFHDTGKPSRQGSFLVSRGYVDRPIGTVSNFDGEGRLRQEHEHDANGRLTREREFDEAGKLLRDEAVFEDGSRKAYAPQR
jgi:antitoxin component YwqK of YwqJK toxin-antitoxin module